MPYVNMKAGDVLIYNFTNHIYTYYNFESFTKETINVFINRIDTILQNPRIYLSIKISGFHRESLFTENTVNTNIINQNYEGFVDFVDGKYVQNIEDMNIQFFNPMEYQGDSIDGIVIIANDTLKYKNFDIYEDEEPYPRYNADFIIELGILLLRQFEYYEALHAFFYEFKLVSINNIPLVIKRL